MGAAWHDEIAGRRSQLLSCACVAGTAGLILCLGLTGPFGGAQAQTTLPPLEVEAKKSQAKPAKQAKQRKTAAPKSAPAQDQAPKAEKTEKAETGTSHVDGYIAKVSGTGTKTDTPLLLTPQSISVITADQIKDQGATSVIEALRYTAGVAVELNSDTRYDETYIRGFRAVQYLDGMPVPFNQWFATPRIEPYSLERIEALKGPASFLFGQNSPGGLLNMISKMPTDVALNEVQLQFGSFNLFQTNFDFGGLATKDGKILYRLTGSVRDAETVVDYTRDDVFYIAPSLTWRPSADTSLTVLANYGFDKGTFPHQYLPAEGTVLPNPNGRLPRSVFAGEPGWDMFDREQWSIGYLLEHKLNDDWKFRQSLRYSSVDMYFQAHRVEGLQADKATVERGAYALGADAGTFTVDNQLQTHFTTGPLQHKVLVGFDYLRMTGDYAFRGAYPPIYGGKVSPINLYNPVYGVVPPPLTDFAQLNYTEQTQLGVYVQDQVKFGNWLLTLGGRQDWAETTTKDLVTGNAPTQNDDAFTGRAGLTYVFPSGLAPYVSYATSFQPKIGFDNSKDQPYQPETGRQYEAGIKYQPAGTNLYVAAAVFDIVQQNYLTFPPFDPEVPSTAFGRQTGEISVRGFDIEVKAKLSRNLDLLLSYAYLDSEVTASEDPDEIGRRVPLVASHAAKAWTKYTFTEGPLVGLWLGGGVRYTGPTIAESTSANPLEIPGFTLFDAGMAYDLGQLDKSLKGAQLSLNVTNLFDTYHVAGYCDLTYCSLGAGRTVLTTLSYKW